MRSGRAGCFWLNPSSTQAQVICIQDVGLTRSCYRRRKVLIFQIKERVPLLEVDEFLIFILSLSSLPQPLTLFQPESAQISSNFLISNCGRCLGMAWIAAWVPLSYACAKSPIISYQDSTNSSCNWLLHSGTCRLNRFDSSVPRLSDANV